MSIALVAERIDPVMNSDTDTTFNRSIVERIALGEAEAVSECLDVYGGLVWSLANRWLRNPADAEDAVQEVFVEVWSKASRFDPTLSSETTFITMLARRRLIDRIRKNGRQLKALGASADVVDIPDSGSLDQPELEDEAAKARACLRKLNPEQQKVMHLSVHEGASQSQIASLLNMPIGTVKSFARRALIQLRRCMSHSAASGLNGAL